MERSEIWNEECSSDLLNISRESGDGDSGAESKELDQNTENCTKKSKEDYMSVRNALLNMTREIQGAEQPAEKIYSEIEIMQVTTAETVSLYNNNCYCLKHDKDAKPSISLMRETNVETDEPLSGHTSSGCSIRCSTRGIDNQCSNCSGETTFNFNVENNSDNIDPLEEKKRVENTTYTTQLENDFKDIFNDITSNEVASEHFSSLDESLSPKAPVAIDELDETILEAPEEFRSKSDSCDCELDNDSSSILDGSDKVFPALCSDLSESEPPNTAPTHRDNDNTVTAETGDTCGRAVDNDTVKIEDRESKISNVNVPAELKIQDICATSEENQQVESVNNDLPSDNREKASEEKCGKADATARHVGICKPATPAEHAIVTDDSNISIRPKVDGSQRSKTDAADNNASDCVTLFPKQRQFSSVKVAENTEIVVGVGCACDPDLGDLGCVPPKPTAVSCSAESVRAENPQTPPTVGPSIGIGVEQCAQAPGCSRVSTVTVCAALTSEERSGSTSCTEQTSVIKDCTNPELCVSNSAKSDSSYASRNYEERCSENPENCHFAAENQLESDIVPPEYKSGKQIKPSNCTLSWEFKNGRLVFEVDRSRQDESERGSNNSKENCLNSINGHLENSLEDKKCEDLDSQSSLDEDLNGILHSRNLNKRVTEGRSRLKHLEQKLKEAGITDEKQTTAPREIYKNTKQNHNCDHPSNEINVKPANIVNNSCSIPIEKQDDDYTTRNLNVPSDNNKLNVNGTSSPQDEENEEDQVDFTGGGFCEFDVRQVSAFAGFDADDYYVVYDELEDTSDDEIEETYCLINRCAMRGDGSMGTDSERSKHNPDHDNLKSLLKKPGRGKDGKKNRVVFNENKNEFFDADYIILIREECDYDEEDDDGVCCCNQHEMVRLTCCEPNCNCNAYDGYGDATPQSPKFAPPLEFVDAVTLSPPEGYKDMELGEQQLLALQQMSRRGQRAAVCRECSATHEDEGKLVIITIKLIICIIIIYW